MATRGISTANPYFPNTVFGDTSQDPQLGTFTSLAPSPYESPDVPPVNPATVMNQPPPGQIATPVPPQQPPAAPLPHHVIDGALEEWQKQKEAIQDRVNQAYIAYDAATKAQETHGQERINTTKYDQHVPRAANQPVNTPPEYDINAGSKSIGGLLKYLPLALLGGVPGATAATAFLGARKDATQAQEKGRYDVAENKYLTAEKNNATNLQNQYDEYDRGLKANQEQNKTAIDSYKATGDVVNDHATAALNYAKLSEKELNDHEIRGAEMKKQMARALSEEMKQIMTAAARSGSKEDLQKNILAYNVASDKRASILGLSRSESDQQAWSDIGSGFQTDADRQQTKFGQQRILEGDKIKGRLDVQSAADKARMDRQTKRQEFQGKLASDANNMKRIVANIGYNGKLGAANIYAQSREHGYDVQGAIEDVKHSEFVDRMKQNALVQGYKIAQGSDKVAINTLNAYKDNLVNARNYVSTLEKQRSNLQNVWKNNGTMLRQQQAIIDTKIDKASTAMDSASTEYAAKIDTLTAKTANAEKDPNPKKVLDLTITPSANLDRLRAVIADRYDSNAYTTHNERQAEQDSQKKNPLLKGKPKASPKDIKDAKAEAASI